MALNVSCESFFFLLVDDLFVYLIVRARVVSKVIGFVAEFLRLITENEAV